MKPRWRQCTTSGIPGSQANREEKCTGKFGESRFNSQALKTEEALLSCIAYVDLNPVRAGTSDTPESSSYTSFRERLEPEFDLQQAIDDQAESDDSIDSARSLIGDRFPT